MKDESIEPNQDKEIYQSIRETVADAKQRIYTVVNSAMVEAYWEIGRQIYEAQGGAERAEYGKRLIEYLSVQLTEEFGKGFAESNLRRMRQFYQSFPIRATLSHELSWSHYCKLIRVENQAARDYYLHECVECNWSTRQLDRQISTHTYERLLSSRESEGNDCADIEAADKNCTSVEVTTSNPTPQSILKDPYILEFLNMKESHSYQESEIEQILIDKLKDFMLELGKGFSFVARQKRITSGGRSYYIDLVLYNYILNCFVLIDLKTGELTAGDVGQMDFYVRLFEDKVKKESDNPTIGIILCSKRDENVVKYSVLDDSKQLFASKYKAQLPTIEELEAELQRERCLLEGE